MTIENISHGEKLRKLLEDFDISILKFAKMAKKSRKWVYDSFKEKEFSPSKAALVSLTLGVEPAEFGFQERFKGSEVVERICLPKKQYYELSKLVKTLGTRVKLLESTNSELMSLNNGLNEYNSELLSTLNKANYLVEKSTSTPSTNVSIDRNYATQS